MSETPSVVCETETAAPCEEGDDLDQHDERDDFSDEEPLVSTVPVPTRWWNPPDPLTEARVKASDEAHAKVTVPSQTQVPNQQVECCICFTTTDIVLMVTYLTYGHCEFFVSCFVCQRHLDVLEERDTLCPKCHALVTSTLKVFV